MEERIKFEFLEVGNPNICELVLRSVPAWFGIEESTIAYINKSKELIMIVAMQGEEPVGFLSLLQHSKYTAEVYVMGVLPTLWDEQNPCQLLVKSLVPSSSFILIENRKLDMSFLSSSLSEAEMKLVNPSANYPFELEYWRNFYKLPNRESTSLLYFDNDKPIGHVALQQNFADDGIVYLCFLYLSKSYRRRGVSIQFLKDIERYFKVDEYYLRIRMLSSFISVQALLSSLKVNKV